MTILITGATGLIGSALSKDLIAKGDTIHYLTTSKDKLENKPNYKGFYWNPTTKEIDKTCFDGVEVIINLAGATIAKRWTKSYKEEIISSRTLTSNLIFETLSSINHTIKQFVSASGTAIYPESYDKVYSEIETETADDFLAKVVKVWEKGAMQFTSLNIDVALIRTGVVYSRKGGAFQELIKPIKYGVGAVMGNGKQVQSWIHLEDLVNLYSFVIEKKLAGIYNAVAPETITNEEQTKAIAKKLSRPLFLPNIPQFMMKMILGEMSLLLFTSKNLSSKKIREKGFTFKYPDLNLALNELI